MKGDERSISLAKGKIDSVFRAKGVIFDNFKEIFSVPIESVEELFGRGDIERTLRVISSSRLRSSQSRLSRAEDEHVGSPDRRLERGAKRGFEEQGGSSYETNPSNRSPDWNKHRDYEKSKRRRYSNQEAHKDEPEDPEEELSTKNLGSKVKEAVQQASQERCSLAEAEAKNLK